MRYWRQIVAGAQSDIEAKLPAPSPLQLSGPSAYGVNKLAVYLC